MHSYSSSWLMLQDDALILKFLAGAEIDEKAKPHSAGSQIVKDLSPVRVGDRVRALTSMMIFP